MILSLLIQIVIEINKKINKICIQKNETNQFEKAITEEDELKFSILELTQNYEDFEYLKTLFLKN